MLFCYPIEATQNNWLHESLSVMIRNRYEQLGSGDAGEAWPMSIPLARRPELSQRPTLKKHLDGLYQALAALDADEQAQVIDALEAQNEIEALTMAAVACPRLEDLPLSIRTPVATLYSYAFEALSELGLRDEHYAVIYRLLKHKLCPFCGCEFFTAPGGPREDLDHYLLKSKYPFAAANLINLVPMGRACNQKYKLAQDILLDDVDRRRRSYFPYGRDIVNVSLARSSPFGGASDRLPNWIVDFMPEKEETRTWAEVFRIRERYIRDVLNPEYEAWLEEFASVCIAFEIPTMTDNELISALTRFVAIQDSLGLSDRAFLKGEVFRMLLRACVGGEARVLSFLRAVLQSIGTP